MTPEKLAYIRYRIERAQEALEVSKLVLDKGHVHDAVNRLYYACFYVVSALLLTEGLHSAKHTGIRSLFLHHWVKTGQLPSEMGRFYSRLFANRQEADYSDMVILDAGEVRAWHEQAAAFVARVVDLIELKTRDTKV